LQKITPFLGELQDDLQYFKNITTATPDPKHLMNVVIMGRKTYESIGRLLPNRINIVLTTQKDYRLAEDPRTKGYVCESYEDAIKLCGTFLNVYKVFVIGGEQVYLRAIKISQVHCIYKTVVHDDFQCDTYFPDVSHCYQLVATSAPESEGNYTFHFELWEKRSSS